jgi:hypothetical protein
MILLFPFEDRKEKIRISSQYELVGHLLDISYFVEDKEKRLDDFYPVESNKEILGTLFPLENLWTTTCFEIFLKNAAGENYYEFNFNSKGDWNVFYFSKYRERVSIEKVPLNLKMETQVYADRIILKYQIDLKKLPSLKLPCQVNIATVTKTDLGITYWSQKHSGQKADFHNPSNFSLNLNINEGK